MKDETSRKKVDDVFVIALRVRFVCTSHQRTMYLFSPVSALRCWLVIEHCPLSSKGASNTIPDPVWYNLLAKKYAKAQLSSGSDHKNLSNGFYTCLVQPRPNLCINYPSFWPHLQDSSLQVLPKPRTQQSPNAREFLSRRLEYWVHFEYYSVLQHLCSL